MAPHSESRRTEHRLQLAAGERSMATRKGQRSHSGVRTKIVTLRVHFLTYLFSVHSLACLEVKDSNIITRLLIVRLVSCYEEIANTFESQRRKLHET
jgi:hypothetical protein